RTCCHVAPYPTALPDPHRSAPVPYTTLFRSRLGHAGHVPAQPPQDALHLPVLLALEHGPLGAQAGDAGRLDEQRLARAAGAVDRSEEHTSELQSRFEIVCRLLLEKQHTEGCC